MDGLVLITVVVVSVTFGGSLYLRRKMRTHPRNSFTGSGDLEARVRNLEHLVEDLRRSNGK